MAKILSHYKAQHADELKTLDLAEKTRNYLSRKELLEIVQSKLEEAKSDSVSIDFLISLEGQLKTALSVTRARKTELLMELVNSLKEKKLLKEENQVLASQLTEIGKMKKFLETEDERAMSPGNSSGKNPPETLPLLK